MKGGGGAHLWVDEIDEDGTALETTRDVRGHRERLWPGEGGRERGQALRVTQGC